MGLAVGGAHWSYSGFNRFRERLAAEVGVHLMGMEGFRRDGQPGESWSKVKDPIKPLLNHPDCDGEMTPKQCEQVAPRLKELVKDWPDGDYDKEQATILAESMEYCAMEEERLVFR